MLISHRHRFIYTKTIKTAVTSVEAYFEPYCMAEGAWQESHSRAEHVSPEGIVRFRGFAGVKRRGQKPNNCGVVRDYHAAMKYAEAGVARDAADRGHALAVVPAPVGPAVTTAFTISWALAALPGSICSRGHG